MSQTSDHDQAPVSKIESPYLTADEAAAYLRTTRQGIYSRVKRGILHPLPGSRGRLLFTRDALDRHLNTRRRR
jgi:excisionase family DNA binding protein